jgi:cell division septal protein FtsQ
MQPELEPSLRPRRKQRRGLLSDRQALAAVLSIEPTRRLSLLAAVAVLGLLAYLCIAPAFYVESATMVGNTRNSDDVLYALSGIGGRQIFQIDAEEVAMRLETLRDVQHAVVRAELPNRVEIRIQETPLVLVWESSALTTAIDEAGHGAALPENTEGLIRVRDESAMLTDAAMSLPVEVVTAARRIGVQFPGPLIYREAIGFIYVNPDGWEIWLGRDGKDVEAQHARLEAVAPGLREGGSEIALIDLRFERNWYYRTKGAAP